MDVTLETFVGVLVYDVPTVEVQPKEYNFSPER